jgi:hypothetical protein
VCLQPEPQGIFIKYKFSHKATKRQIFDKIHEDKSDKAKKGMTG